MAGRAHAWLPHVWGALRGRPAAPDRLPSPPHFLPQRLLLATKGGSLYAVQGLVRHLCHPSLPPDSHDLSWSHAAQV
eukprot:3237144-Pleurochrysis_carterae.AAC.1